MTSKEELFELPAKKAIVKFVLPCVLTQLITIIYGMADTFFVGRLGDPLQVAALSLSFPLTMVFTAISNLFGIGANSNIARLLGKKQPDEAKYVSSFAFWYSLCVGVIISVILLIFNKPILLLVGSSVNTYPYTFGYVKWVVIIGCIPSVGSMVLSNLLRSEGMAKSASNALMCGGILNIFLDPLFIFAFKLGSEGAGIATFLSHVFSFVYMLVILRKTKGSTVLSLNPKYATIPLKKAGGILIIGMPAFLSIILGCCANFILNHYMTGYGDINTAAFGIVQKVGNFTTTTAVGVASGFMPLLGYHFAAKNTAKFREYSRIAFIMLGIFTGACLLIYEIFAPYIIGAFIKNEETVLLGTKFLHRWMISCPGMCFSQLFNGLFQAVGCWQHSTIMSLARQGIVFIPMLLILNKAVGMYGLVFAEPISDTVALIIGFILYANIVKKKLEEIT